MNPVFDHSAAKSLRDIANNIEKSFNINIPSDLDNSLVIRYSQLPHSLCQ